MDLSFPEKKNICESDKQKSSLFLGHSARSKNNKILQNEEVSFYMINTDSWEATLSHLFPSILQLFSSMFVYMLTLSPTGGGPQRPAPAELAIAPKRMYVLI